MVPSRGICHDPCRNAQSRRHNPQARLDLPTGRNEQARGWAARAAVALRLALRAVPALMAAQVLIAALPTPAGASQVELGGKVGHYLFYGTGQGALLQNEARYQLSVRARPGWDGQVYLLWKGTAALSSPTGSSLLFDRPPSNALPNLDEAYLDLYFPAVDLRLGRQVVRWGTADGINPTDVINPRSVSLEALIDREVRSLPVPAVRAAFSPRPALGLTAVGVADFVAAPFPTEGVYEMARAAVEKPPLGGTLAPDWLTLGPTPSGGPWELAVRAEGMVRGYNVYLSYFNGYDDFPALWMAPTGQATWRVRGEYRRQQQFGLAAAGTVGDAGVWAEAAYTLPERLSVLDIPPPTVVALSTNQGTWQAVVGGDYTFSGDVYLSGQVVYNQAGSLLLPYHPPTEQTGIYATALVRYSPPSRYTWDALVLANLRDWSALVAPGVAYELKPGLKLSVRYLDVVGADGTEFGRLRSQLQGVATRLELAF